MYIYIFSGMSDVCREITVTHNHAHTHNTVSMYTVYTYTLYIQRHTYITYKHAYMHTYIHTHIHTYIQYTYIMIWLQAYIT